MWYVLLLVSPTKVPPSPDSAEASEHCGMCFEASLCQDPTRYHTQSLYTVEREEIPTTSPGALFSSEPRGRADRLPSQHLFSSVLHNRARGDFDNNPRGPIFFGTPRAGQIGLPSQHLFSSVLRVRLISLLLFRSLTTLFELNW